MVQKSINKSQSDDLSDYSSLVSSLARTPKQPTGDDTNIDSDWYLHPLNQFQPSAPYVKPRTSQHQQALSV